MEIYEKIRYYREHTDFSQRNVAKILGISRNTVKKYWEGRTVPWKRKLGSGRKNDIITDDVKAFMTYRKKSVKTQSTRPCEKISVNSTTVIKNDIVGRLEKQPLNFFTVYNKYRNLSSFFNSQSAEMERSGMEAD